MSDVRLIVNRAKQYEVALRLGLVAENSKLLPESLRAQIGNRKAEIIALLAGDLVRHSLQAKTQMNIAKPPGLIFPVARRSDPILLRGRPKQWSPVADAPIKGDYCEACNDGQIFEETASGWRCVWCVCGDFRDPIRRTIFCGAEQQ